MPVVPYLIGIGLGFLLGWIFVIHYVGSKMKRQKVTAGNIVINTTNPQKDTIRIELDIPVAEMMESERLEFTVMKEES